VNYGPHSTKRKQKTKKPGGLNFQKKTAYDKNGRRFLLFWTNERKTKAKGAARMREMRCGWREGETKTI
jgi:hypothetical protein